MATENTVLERINALHAQLTAALEPIREELTTLNDVLYDATGAAGGDPVRQQLFAVEDNLDNAVTALIEASAAEAEQPTEQLA